MSILPDLYFTLRNIPAKPSGSLRSAGLVTHQRAFGAAAAAAAFHSLSRALCRVSGMEIETEMAQPGRQYRLWSQRQAAEGAAGDCSARN
jgi:hypothetical protein